MKTNQNNLQRLLGHRIRAELDGNSVWEVIHIEEHPCDRPCSRERVIPAYMCCQDGHPLLIRKVNPPNQKMSEYTTCIVSENKDQTFWEWLGKKYEDNR